MRSIVLTVLFALAACAEITDVFVPLPDHGGARSLILVLSTAEHVSAEVIDLESPPSSSPAVFVGGGGRDGALVEAVLYPLTLSELGVRAGPLTSTTPRGIALDAPITRFTRRQALRIDADRRTGPWQESPGLSGQASALTIPGPRTRCATFVAATEILPGLGGGVFSLAWGSSQAVVGVESGDVYLVSLDKTEPLTWTSTKAKLTGGLVLGQDELWLGGPEGWLARAHVGGQLEIVETSTAPSRDRLWYLTGLRTPQGTELHSLSNDGFIERYRDGQWLQLADLPGGVGDLRSGGIAAIGPGEAIVAWPGAATVFRIRGDTVAPEELPTTEGLTAAAYVPGIGALVADAAGQVFVDPGTRRWEPLGAPPRQYLMLSIVPYEDGFVAGSGAGDIVQFVPDEGYCPSQQVTTDNVRAIAVVGRDLISVENADRDAPTPLVRARRAE